MAHGLLITMPNKQAHAALSILKQSRILAPDVTEVGAIKHVMKLIADSLSAAKIAPAKVAWEARPGKSASLHRQSMRTNPELNQCPEPGDAHRQLIVRLIMNFARAAKPMMICAQLGPLGRNSPGRRMQACLMREREREIQIVHSASLAYEHESDVMPLIAYCMCIAQRALAQLPGGPLALQACLAQQAGNGSPAKTASIPSTWKEA